MNRYQENLGSTGMPLFDNIVASAVKTEAPQVPIARASDPSTSHEGAAHIESKRKMCANKMFDAICKIDQGDGVTAREAASWCLGLFDGDFESYRKRIGTLKAAGRIVFVHTRPCKTNGRTASTYRAVK